jgi:cyclopropane fatty-acyl-phospholipid synthase-like methyltransferase
LSLGAAAEPRDRAPASRRPGRRTVLRALCVPGRGAAAVLAALARVGFATEHVYGFTADYPETLTHWLTRLEDHLEEAGRLAAEQRIRVWGIYLRAARSGFQTGFTSVYQVRAHLA